MKFKPGKFKFIAASGAPLIAALLLSGCASEPPATLISEHLPPPPAAEFGPEFEVLKAPRLSYVANGVMDSAGRVQMITGKKGELRHLSIGAQGVESSEIVRADYYARRTNRYVPIGMHRGQENPLSVDIVLDRAGNFHVLADDEHFVKKDGNWTGGQRTPCLDGKIKAPLDGCRDIKFVKGMPDLTWAFFASGHQMGFPYTWRNHTTAPWPTDYLQLLVVPEETPYRNFHVLFANDRQNIEVGGVIGNRHNIIHAISHLSLVSFDLSGECPKPDPHAWHQQEKDALKLPIAGTLCPVDGMPFYEWLANELDPKTGAVNPIVQKFNHVPDSYLHYFPAYAYVVDPDTGRALVISGNGVSLEADTSQNGRFAELPISNFVPYVQAVGGGRFYALMVGTARPGGDRPVYFLEYCRGAWSAPVEIGTTSRTFFYDDNDIFKIISDNAGRALLMWPTEDALVARWVKLK